MTIKFQEDDLPYYEVVRVLADEWKFSKEGGSKTWSVMSPVGYKSPTDFQRACISELNRIGRQDLTYYVSRDYAMNKDWWQSKRGIFVNG